ncbi:uncharacterized protein LJ206_012525 isoform 2-T7 [Theristicus caerulescens]
MNRDDRLLSKCTVSPCPLCFLPRPPPPPRALSFQSMPGETASTCKKGARWHLGMGVLRRHRITGGKHRINWISMTEISPPVCREG